ncbi:hypothetical protein E8E14_013914 [Neopestalotiopsis sp. 37M]|nr:hypothetical protein E8E14_013914 [Neopestalotiopsis sp. 37M]
MPSAPAKQRGPKRNTVSRSARLEEKLDQLVTLLQAQRSGRGDDGGNSSGDDGFEMGDETDSLTDSMLSTPATGEDIFDVFTVVGAQDCIQGFRDQLMLQQVYPFFWLNIMAVTSNSSKLRKSLSLQARHAIIERVVAGASQLVVSLVWDLGLQMPPPEHPPRFPPLPALAMTQQPVAKERTIEEQRVVLGAFVITSMISQTFKVAEGLRWSAYLDDYLVQVSNSTMLLDQVLVRQVKMQLIVNQVRQTSYKMGTMETSTAWVGVLQAQLDDLIANTNSNTSTFGSECE